MQVRHATAFYPASGWSYAGRRFGKVIDTANTEKESAS